MGCRAPSALRQLGIDRGRFGHGALVRILRDQGRRPPLSIRGFEATAAHAASDSISSRVLGKRFAERRARGAALWLRDTPGFPARVLVTCSARDALQPGLRRTTLPTRKAATSFGTLCRLLVHAGRKTRTPARYAKQLRDRCESVGEFLVSFGFGFVALRTAEKRSRWRRRNA